LNEDWLSDMQNKVSINTAILLILVVAIVGTGIAFAVHQTVDHEDEHSYCLLVLNLLILSGYTLSRLFNFSYVKLSPALQTGTFTTSRLDRPPKH